MNAVDYYESDLLSFNMYFYKLLYFDLLSAVLHHTEVSPLDFSM